MNKREALIQACKYAAKAIEEYVGDGGLDMHNDFETVSEQDKVEREMYDIADKLRMRAAKLEGDDGED